MSSTPCLVPRPHYSARPKRFGSRTPSEDVSSPRIRGIGQEGPGKRRTGNRQPYNHTTELHCH